MFKCIKRGVSIDVRSIQLRGLCLNWILLEKICGFKKWQNFVSQVVLYLSNEKCMFNESSITTANIQGKSNS